MNVLKALEAKPGVWVSGESIARAEGLTRAAVHKRIDKLRSLGHQIEGSARLGYRWTPSPALFRPDALPGPWGQPCRHVASTPSTQDDAKRWAQEGAAEGALVAADRQTEGRGRGGRAWLSPPGGLWMSLILKPAMDPSRLPAVGLAGALAMVRAVRRVSGVQAHVKWPNDVWIGERKLAGFLMEASVEIGRVHWAVLGAGVNVNNDAPGNVEPRAVSLREAAGEDIDVTALAAAWLAETKKLYAVVSEEGFSPLRAAFERHSLLRGRDVTVRRGNECFLARALGVDADGRLRVRSGAKTLTLTAEEVSLRPQPGVQ